ncbi:MAG: 30S ribosomal protein S6 [Ignavibacterium sp.]|nr:30S ribosomal protein S6 [Ignavibacterium sp.]
MRTGIYESAVLINAALDDQQIDSILTRIKDLITNNGGQIRELDNWGRKRLAYPVEKSKIGYYAIYRFDAPSDLIAKLERAYTLDEQILRFVTLKLSADALEQLEKNKTLSSTIKDEIIPNSVEVVPTLTEEDTKEEENDK